MKIAIDMDNTLADEFGREVRPGIIELLNHLKADGHELVLWTSSTRNRAEIILAELKLKDLFSTFLYREDYDPKNAGVAKDLRLIGAHATG